MRAPQTLIMCKLGLPTHDVFIHLLRQVDLFASSGEQITTLSSEYQTAISSRNIFNSDGTALAAATASGRVHIYR